MRRNPAALGFDDEISSKFYQIAHHRTTGGHLTGALAIEERRSGRISFDIDGIEDPFYGGKEMALWNHGGMNPCLYLPVINLSNGQEFNPVSELSTEFDIERRDLRNPADEDLFELDRCSKGKLHQDGEFMGGIDSFNIASGIRLCKTLLLGFFQTLFKTPSFIGHLGENVIG